MNNQRRISGSVTFRIAGHLTELILGERDWKKLLPSFIPFRCHPRERESPVFVMKTAMKLSYIDFTSARLLNEMVNVWGACLRILEVKEYYVVDMQSLEKGIWHRMVCDKEFRSMRSCIRWDDPMAGDVLNMFMMIAFAQSVVLRKTVLMHASVVEKDGLGFAFLGESGTGKSTHSKLWVDNLVGAELLNDDNPAVCVKEDGNVYIYGTPWSGKTSCYRASSVPLAALVHLEQAPFNSFLQHEGVKALITLLPGCSSMRWNCQLYTAMCDTLEKIIGHVPVCTLKCLPQSEAALLCYNKVMEIINKK
ncbi:MAG: phosphoenolpyruvate carboxykinase [Bacteroides sp.]|jgi:hypothetical protein|nr:phosphoenolpyruvate carboxykinase [Bacteroides sp.]MCI1684037.1 phosphoenolpyruvate carboxykinase [Bacteroides sp.]